MGLLSKARSALDMDDLVSAGTIGLLAALARYDPSRGVKFRTYAVHRIRGMMLDEIRAMDWVPRSIRARRDHVYKAVASLADRDGHLPLPTDIAESLGLSCEEVEESLADFVPVISLDEPIAQDDETYALKDILADHEHPDPFTSCASMEMSRALDIAIHRLPEKHQRVIRWYYFHGWSLKEIGWKLNLTESAVCRIHAQGVRRLYSALEPYAGNGDSCPASRSKGPIYAKDWQI